MKQTESDYKARVTRIIDAIQLKKPDRVPVLPRFALDGFPAAYCGYTAKDMWYDVDKCIDAATRCTLELGFDVKVGASAPQGKVYEMLEEIPEPANREGLSVIRGVRYDPLAKVVFPWCGPVSPDKSLPVIVCTRGLKDIWYRCHRIWDTEEVLKKYHRGDGRAHFERSGAQDLLHVFGMVSNWREQGKEYKKNGHARPYVFAPLFAKSEKRRLYARGY